MFHEPPRIEKQIDSLVRKDNPLKEEQGSGLFQSKISHDLSRPADRQIIEEGSVWNDVDLRERYMKLRLQLCRNRVGVTDDCVDTAIQTLKDLLVASSSIVREQIMHRENDFCASALEELDEPEIHRQTPSQHGQKLHMDNIGWSNQESDGQGAQVQNRLSQFKDSAWKLRQPKLSYNVQ